MKKSSLGVNELETLTAIDRSLRSGPLSAKNLSDILGYHRTHEFFTSFFFTHSLIGIMSGIYTRDLTAVLLGLVVGVTDSNAADLFARSTIVQDIFSGVSRLDYHEPLLCVRSFMREGVHSFVQSIGRLTQSVDDTNDLYNAAAIDIKEVK